MADQQPPSSTPATPGPAISAGEFGAAFKGFLERTVAAPDDEPVFAARLRAHFGTDPAVLPIVTEQFEPPSIRTSRRRWTPGCNRRGARRRPWG